VVPGAPPLARMGATLTRERLSSESTRHLSVQCLSAKSFLEMNLCHAAAFVLAGWCMISPPVIDGKVRSDLLSIVGKSLSKSSQTCDSAIAIEIAT
jgi:hypothetical protein